MRNLLSLLVLTLCLVIATAVAASPIYDQAEKVRKREEARKGFFIHLTVYVLVNLLLVSLNLILAPEFLWFFFPLCGWGIGLTMHYLMGVRFADRGEPRATGTT